MIKTTISSEGQISIPPVIRKRLNLTPGTEVMIDVQGEALVLKRVVATLPDWRTMRGMIKSGGSLTEALMEDRRADIARDNALIEERAAELAQENARINKGS